MLFGLLDCWYLRKNWLIFNTCYSASISVTNHIPVTYMNLNFIQVLSSATVPLLQGLFKVSFLDLIYEVYSALESSVEFYAMYKGNYKNLIHR